jgi:hypothetical protein
LRKIEKLNKLCKQKTKNSAFLSQIIKLIVREKERDFSIENIWGVEEISMFVNRTKKKRKKK